MDTINTFQVGHTYAARCISDSNITFTYKVVKRTAKFLTVEDKWGDQKRCGVKISDGREFALPDGSYAWAPIIYSTKEA